MEMSARSQPSKFGVSIGEAARLARYAYLTRREASWADAHLLTRPDILYDISATPLVYQFYVVSRLDCVGVIRIAADTRLGTPVLSVQYARSLRPDIDGAARLLAPKAAFRMPDHRIIDWYPVIYSYPKTGLQFVFVASGAPDADPYPVTVIMDLDTMAPVADLPEGGAGEDVDGNEAYSLIRAAETARLRGRGAREAPGAAWRRRARTILDLLDSFDAAEGGGGLPTETEGRALAARFGVEEGSFPAHGQIDTYHCALASAQMILEYLTGERIEQRDLEQPFQKGAFGTTNAAQVAGYARLLGTRPFAPSGLDETPTAREVVEVLDAGLPMKSGVPRHARVCCGYRRVSVRDTQNRVVCDDIELLIHDPWPPNEGKIYWEGWNDIVHTNFIYMTKTGETKTLQGATS